LIEHFRISGPLVLSILIIGIGEADVLMDTPRDVHYVATYVILRYARLAGRLSRRQRNKDARYCMPRERRRLLMAGEY